MKNSVANILKNYSYINGAVGIILALILWEELEILSILIISMVIFINFLIYALGEVIELLYQIKINTGKTCDNMIVNNRQTEDDELPEI